MLEAFLLYYLIGVPFLTAPISRPDFPVALEILMDTSDIPLASNTYTWITEHEIQANIQTGRTTFMTTILALNPDGTVKEERKNRENSDSLYFVEKYQYQDGKLLYEGDGTITVKKFAIPSDSDAVLNNVLLKDGRIHEIL